MTSLEVAVSIRDNNYSCLHFKGCYMCPLNNRSECGSHGSVLRKELIESFISNHNGNDAITRIVKLEKEIADIKEFFNQKESHSKEYGKFAIHVGDILKVTTGMKMSTTMKDHYCKVVGEDSVSFIIDIDGELCCFGRCGSEDQFARHIMIHPVIYRAIE